MHCLEFRNIHLLESRKAELPARHQVIIPIRTKYKSCIKDGCFWVKAVNLTANSVTIFKNQRTGIISQIEDMSEPFHLNSKKETFAVSSVKTHNSKTTVTLKEIEVDLADSKLNSTQAKQLEKLVLSYCDIFSQS